jgi:hypothetical protein
VKKDDALESVWRALSSWRRKALGFSGLAYINLVPT